MVVMGQVVRAEVEGSSKDALLMEEEGEKSMTKVTKQTGGGEVKPAMGRPEWRAAAGWTPTRARRGTMRLAAVRRC